MLRHLSSFISDIHTFVAVNAFDVASLYHYCQNYCQPGTRQSVNKNI